jgi:hypothetical protein
MSVSRHSRMGFRMWTADRFPEFAAKTELMAKWACKHPCLRHARRIVAPRRKISASTICIAAALLAATPVGMAETVPLPRERPVVAPGAQSRAAETAGAPSPCQLRLAELAAFEPSPPIAGPGQCMANDVVKVDAVLLPDGHRVALSPPATLRCPMAEAVAQWIASDVAPTIAASGTSLRRIENLDSFDCRPRNGVTGAQVSEHGHANALDVRALKLANGEVIELNNASVAKSLREKLRDTACTRFSTVLGNGADAYHESHVHLDLLERRTHYRICQWDVLDPAETAALAAKKAAAAAAHVAAGMRQASDVPLPRPRPAVDADVVNLPRHDVPRNWKEGTMRTRVALAVAASLASPTTAYAGEQTVTVGPWTIAAAYKGERFADCSMSRSADELGIMFLRAQDGLALLLNSEKWKLERGKAYIVRLGSGSRSIEARAMADSKAVAIGLVDAAFNRRLRHAGVLEVRGDGATLRVPLDGSTAALRRLEACFNRNSRAGIETNPFVAHSRKP